MLHFCWDRAILNFVMTWVPRSDMFLEFKVILFAWEPCRWNLVRSAESAWTQGKQLKQNVGAEGPCPSKGELWSDAVKRSGIAWNCDILPLRNDQFWTQFVSRSMWFCRCVSYCFLLRSLCCCSVLNQTPRGAPWMYSVQLVQIAGEQNRGEWGEQCLLSGLSMALSGICEMIRW